MAAKTRKPRPDLTIGRAFDLGVEEGEQTYTREEVIRCREADK